MTAQHNEITHESVTAAVVVGADGSPASQTAVRWAADIAAQRGRALHIEHGLDLVAVRAVLGNYEVMSPAVTDTMRAHAEQVLAAAGELAHSAHPDLTIATELSEAKPAELLIARSKTAHMVVLGSTPGVGTFTHLGSTLLAVTAHGHGAIVVVRGTEPVARTSGPVVVGVDGSVVGEAAIGAAFAEASLRGAELVAVHAWSDLSAGEFAGVSYLDIPIPELDVAENALLAERLAGWQEKFPDVTVTRKVYPAGPRKHLGEWSESAQLIVVGSRGRGGFRGLLLGSTSNWLVQHADCPVMVVHPE
ncbi:universal stress protein [Nocardia brasiliensis]|uniref:universal stress protein n=1 Tax=Nocardia brasiliensis TaxID=37326 RepID=UPI0004A7290E|nr:universal stress protein [Nocardia brasiliensis]